MPVTKQDDMIQITVPTPFSVGDVHFYLIKGDRLTLIDAGVNTPEAEVVLHEAVKEAGYRVADIEQLILTHHHPDHTGLCDQIEADIYAHKYAKSWLSQEPSFMAWRRQFFTALFQEFGVPAEWMAKVARIDRTLQYGAVNSQVTGFLKEGDELPGLNGFQVMEVPGHAQSHLVFYRERDGVLLAGDHVLKAISSNPLIEPPLEEGADRPKSLLQYNQSLKKMLEIDPAVVWTGHGEPITSGFHSLIERRFERQHERAVKVLHMLQQKPMTVLETTLQLFPDAFEREPGLTMSETVGQIDYLLEKGWIQAQKTAEGAVQYRASTT